MRRASALVVMLVLGLLALAPSAKAGDNFVATLSGDQAVPARDTKAVGVATFKLHADGTALRFKVNVANLDDAVAAHIHCGGVGVNGPVGVTLFLGAPAGGGVNGTLAEGTITAPDPGNGCGWVDLAGAGRDRKRRHLCQRAHQRRGAAGQDGPWGLPRRGDPRPDPIATHQQVMEGGPADRALLRVDPLIPESSCPPRARRLASEPQRPAGA